jgi:hypothetical protein
VGIVSALVNTRLVYTDIVEAAMKNITLSADERVIEEARQRAHRENTTLNEQFRRWLDEYVGKDDRAERAIQAIEAIRKNFQTSGPYSRDELNER